MSRRRAVVVAVLALVVIVGHVALVRAMAHGHVAHVLLGSGNAAPPLAAASLAVALVVVRFVAVVISPGALLAAASSLVAHAVLGPPHNGGESTRQRGQRDGAADGEGSGTISGTGTKPGGSASGSSAVALGRGLSIEGRGT